MIGLNKFFPLRSGNHILVFFNSERDCQSWIMYKILVRWTETNVPAKKEDNATRHFDLSPLYRAIVEFDQIADLIDRVLASDGASTTYPHLNIEKKRTMPTAFSLPTFQLMIFCLKSKKMRSLLLLGRTMQMREKLICIAVVQTAPLKNGFSFLIKCMLRLQARSIT